MRLGLYPADARGGLARRARPTARQQIEERHRHRYEVNNAYRDQLEEAGLVFSGTRPGPRPGRVRRAAPRRAPLLRLDPGAPRAPLPADPPAPAVRGPDRRRDRAAARAPVPDRRDRPAPRAGRGRDRSPSSPMRRSAWPVVAVDATCTAAAGWSRCVATGSGRPATARRRAVRAPGPRASRRRVVLARRRPEGRARLPVGSTATPARAASSSSRPAAATCRARTRSRSRQARAARRRPGWRRRSGRTCHRRTPRPASPARSIHFFLARGLREVERGDFVPSTRRRDMETVLGAVRRPARRRAATAGSRTRRW